MSMFDVFLAEVLILLLLCIVSARIFFTKKPRIDSWVALAPSAIVLSLLLLYVWNTDVVILALCVLSLFSFVINIRSLFRLSARLYVDHYNVRFIIPTILILLVSLALLGLIVLFRPVRYHPSDFGVTKTKSALTGTMATGYQVRDRLFEKSNFTGVLYEYAPSEENPARASVGTDTAPVMLFVPKVSATVQYYEPYFLLLAQRGYRVLTADFTAFDRHPFSYEILNTRFFRRLYALYLHFFQPEQLSAVLQADAEYVVRGYAALCRLALGSAFAGEAGEPSDQTCFLVFDSLTLEQTSVLTEQYGERLVGSYWINRIEEYTSPNFGFLEQTDPLMAHFFGGERDKTFFIPRYVAGKTVESILLAQKLAQPAEIIKSETQGDAK